MAKNIIIAVDAKERTLDALALGRLLTQATKAPSVLVTVFAYNPLSDPDSPDMAALRDEAHSTLLQLGASEGLAVTEAQVIAGNFAARELHRVTEQPDAGLIVVGSTTRGPVGRLLVGGVGERLLAGAACPVAIAPHGYAAAHPSHIGRIGVGLDGSDEARRALDGAIALARAGDARIRVITAYQRLAFGGVATATLPSQSANDAMRTQLRAIHDEALDRVRPHVEADSRFVDGPADRVLMRESGDVDLLVVGSRGYGPLGAVLLGSASTALARTAICPLLITPLGTQFDVLT